MFLNPSCALSCCSWKCRETHLQTQEICLPSLSAGQKLQKMALLVFEHGVLYTLPYLHPLNHCLSHQTKSCKWSSMEIITFIFRDKMGTKVSFSSRAKHSGQHFDICSTSILSKMLLFKASLDAILCSTTSCTVGFSLSNVFPMEVATGLAAEESWQVAQRGQQKTFLRRNPTEDLDCIISSVRDKFPMKAHQRTS